MKQRAITGAIMTLIFVPLLLLDVLLVPFQVVVGLLAMMAVFELIRMYERENKLNWSLKVVLFILTAVIYIAVSNVWQPYNTTIHLMSLDISLVLIPAILILLVFCIFMPDLKDKGLGFSLLTVLYVGLGFGALSFLKVIGAQFIIYLLIITITTDMFAFFFGIKFGKHKMAPTISPKKSWEGAIAGTAFGTIIGTLFAITILPAHDGTLFNLAKPEVVVPVEIMTMFDAVQVREVFVWKLLPIVLPITLSISIIGQVGDLFASKLKRTYEIKDFGTIFPGHGGVLDRFDSAIFAGMFLVFVLKTLSLIWPGL
ncbi:MAG: phosphatidate cytidylyltransferase [Acholeplasmataceae bacterium]|jgi:phosphatidate cytidylyltransferase